MAKKKDNSQLDVPGVGTEPLKDITASLHPALRRHLLWSHPWLRALPEDGEDALFNPALRHLLRINHSKQFREHILARAETGDWDALGAYIAIGGVITREERKFLTAVLRGKKKRSANRAGLMRTQVLKSARVAMAELIKAEGKTQGDVDAEVACRTRVKSPRTIQRDREDIEQTRDEAAPGEIYEGPIPDDVVEMVNLRDRILRFPEEIAAQRYVISLTALSPHFMS